MTLTLFYWTLTLVGTNNKLSIIWIHCLVLEFLLFNLSPLHMESHHNGPHCSGHPGIESDKIPFKSQIEHYSHDDES